MGNSIIASFSFSIIVIVVEHIDGLHGGIGIIGLGGPLECGIEESLVLTMFFWGFVVVGQMMDWMPEHWEGIGHGGDQQEGEESQN
jgi:hypothetical protein